MTMNFEVPAPFRIDFTNKLHVVVVGLGGTGGYLFPNLARVVTQLNNSGRKDILLSAVDGDVIEEKNVNRQNFFFPDIGKNKADLMTSRHGRLFGQEFGTVTSYLEDEETFKEVVFQDDRLPIVVSCVDNHKTRQLISRVYNTEGNEFIWLDSGNEQFSGQVVLGYNGSYRLEEGDRHPHMFRLPSVTDVFPEILTAETRFNSEVSCDEMAVDNIQNIAANIMASTIQFSMLNLLLGDNAEQGYLTNFMVEFDSRTSSTLVHQNVYSKLSQY